MHSSILVTTSRRAIPILCTALLIASVTGCKSRPQEAPPSAAITNPNEVAVTPSLAGNLKFGAPSYEQVEGTLQVAARVETNARDIAQVGSPVAGRIVNLLVFEGQAVKAGTTLALLHSNSLSDTQFALIKATSQRNLAATSVKRAEQLVEADVIGHAELERRRAEFLQADTEAASYRTQLRGLGMTSQQIRDLENSHRLSADYPIVAPRAGTVLKREVTIGQVVQPADLAFTIANLSTVWIVANVPEEDAGRLYQGMEVTARIPAMQKELRGRLTFVSPIVDPATRTVAVRMDAPNPDGQLKPDQLANMTFVGRTDRKLTIPNTAVVREENKDFVFVQSAPEKYLLREVSLGDETNDRRVVLAGLQESDRIVLDGAFHLNNQRKQNAIKGAK
ncbi:efflux RND transporter periplasmic adaptor subunit [Edaphobacter flagellatus]|uniref:efflux RND transporter periplasmic adaptor subunit n=1 Tax=Edaphobacter flagellatus TaxID=1933044 RepID=UPI0021B1B88A|nr:efflux RND transporter periplasmic adaptor subunit [Edaphobacter flagellatus]